MRKDRDDHQARQRHQHQERPGRIHAPGDGTRTDKQRRSGSYGAGLIAAGNAKRRDAMAKMHPLRDQHGAYTMTGRDTIEELFGSGPFRRVWLAGISAQRGY